MTFKMQAMRLTGNGSWRKEKKGNIVEVRNTAINLPFPVSECLVLTFYSRKSVFFTLRSFIHSPNPYCNLLRKKAGKNYVCSEVDSTWVSFVVQTGVPGSDPSQEKDCEIFQNLVFLACFLLQSKQELTLQTSMFSWAETPHLFLPGDKKLFVWKGYLSLWP